MGEQLPHNIYMSHFRCSIEGSCPSCSYSLVWVCLGAGEQLLYNSVMPILGGNKEGSYPICSLSLVWVYSRGTQQKFHHLQVTFERCSPKTCPSLTVSIINVYSLAPNQSLDFGHNTLVDCLM